MASSKQKTTMNKLNRERKLRERRIDKQARKLARANGEVDTQDHSPEQLDDGIGELVAPPVSSSPIEYATQVPIDA